MSVSKLKGVWQSAILFLSIVTMIFRYPYGWDIGLNPIILQMGIITGEIFKKSIRFYFRNFKPLSITIVRNLGENRKSLMQKRVINKSFLQQNALNLMTFVLMIS